MRYHIDTIPVWDAIKLEGECLFCALRRKTELGETERYLGASVMEPDIRIKVNAKGFCAKHQLMLFGFENRLGHALLLQTQLAETTGKVLRTQENLRKEQKGGLSGLLKGKAEQKSGFRAAAAEIRRLSEGCVLCDSITESMARYVHTFFHLYQNDAEFRKRFLDSKGVCLEDMALLLETAGDELSSKDAQAFAAQLYSLQEKSLATLQEDVDWFIKKFDYRFKAEPWKNSKDAVERGVNKLQGWCVGKEPNPKET